MKRKLATIMVMLTLGIGYCKPPQPDCTGMNQTRSECRGFIAPPVLRTK